MRPLLIFFCVLAGLILLTLLVYLSFYLSDVHRDKRAARVIRSLVRRHLAAPVPRLPACVFPRGIVIVAGGPVYGPLALRVVKQLDHLQSRLPVEVWALDAQELEHDSMRELAAHPRVHLHNLSQEVEPMVGRKRHCGYRAKSLALQHSACQQVLLLDADNVPLVKPDDLFDADDFVQHGVVFWPDVQHFDRPQHVKLANVGWLADWRFNKCLGAKQPRVRSMSSFFRQLGLSREQSHCRRQFESGQMLVDRRRCAYALPLMAELNRHHKTLYSVLLGDKDTYALACDLLGVAYHGVEFAPAWGGSYADGEFRGYVCVQRHPATGAPCFAHFLGQCHKSAATVHTINTLMLPESYETRQVVTLDTKSWSHAYTAWYNGSFVPWVLSVDADGCVTLNSGKKSVTSGKQTVDQKSEPQKRQQTTSRRA